MIAFFSSPKSAASDSWRAQESELSNAGDPLTSRHERLRQLRLAKKKRAEPRKPGRIERHFLGLDRKGHESFDADNFRGFYPGIDWIAPGSGVAGGARYWRPEAIGAVDVLGSAFYSWRQYQHYDVQVGLIPNRGRRIPSASFTRTRVDQLGSVRRARFSRLRLYGNLRYRDLPDETFFGLGPDSRRDDRAQFRLKESLFEVAAGYQLTQRIAWTVKSGLLQNDARPGKVDALTETPDLFGEEGGVDYLRFETTLLLDYRDELETPHKGGMFAVSWLNYRDTSEIGQFSFRRWALDSRAFLPLGTRQRVLALRAVLVNSSTANGNRIPFFMQPTLGGSRTLRGYDSYRFRGEDAMLYQLEYRWEANTAIELALFLDAGTVSDPGGSLSFDDLKTDWGVGFRLKALRSVLFRFDLAWSNETSKTVVRVNAVF